MVSLANLLAKDPLFYKGLCTTPPPPSSSGHAAGTNREDTTKVRFDGPSNREVEVQFPISEGLNEIRGCGTFLFIVRPLETYKWHGHSNRVLVSLFKPLTSTPTLL